jgi:hypothetical protein
VLSDELQEYLRWEGARVKKHLKFNYHPTMTVEVNEEARSITTDVTFSFDGKDKEALIERAREVARFQRLQDSVDDINAAVDLLGNTIKRALESKLRLGEDFRVTLSLSEDWSKMCYRKELSSAE